MTKDTTTPARSGPLAGLRILELGTMIAGPVVGTLLADFGAEVIKIEQPGTGDTLRQIGPFEQGESLYWNVEGRNKKSVTLDLRLPEGQALLRDLARQADAVVENFRPGTLTKWGLNYAELARANPRIVMLSISGFGQTGPNASQAAYDRIALAFGGLMHLTGYPDRPPLKSGNSLADYQSALFGAFALMMALYQRDACGGRGSTSTWRCTNRCFASPMCCRPPTTGWARCASGRAMYISPRRPARLSKCATAVSSS